VKDITTRKAAATLAKRTEGFTVTQQTSGMAEDQRLPHPDPRTGSLGKRMLITTIVVRGKRVAGQPVTGEWRRMDGCAGEEELLSGRMIRECCRLKIEWKAIQFLSLAFDHNLL
jgi:hypothetical protein